MNIKNFLDSANEIMKDYMDAIDTAETFEAAAKVGNMMLGFANAMELMAESTEGADFWRVQLVVREWKTEAAKGMYHKAMETCQPRAVCVKIWSIWNAAERCEG